MKCLVCKLLKKKNLNGDLIGYCVSQLSEEIFDVSGAFFWVDFDNNFEFQDFGELYYDINDSVIKEYILEEDLSIEQTITPPVDESITDEDLL